jgi:hypothetical protein
VIFQVPVKPCRSAEAQPPATTGESEPGIARSSSPASGTRLGHGPQTSSLQARRTEARAIGGTENAGRRVRRNGIINLDAERETEVSGG